MKNPVVNYLKMLAAIGLVVIGFPGLVDDFVQWQDLLALASWWNVAFMITGFMLFIHGAFRWNFREQISKLRAYLIGLVTAPDWLAEARGKQSFKLYELACLISRIKPSWPLPSDEAEWVYDQILQSLPLEVTDKLLSDGHRNVRDIELNRRQARACVPYKYWEYVGNGNRRSKEYPWFIREEFDQVIPDDRTDEDDRKLIVRKVDEKSS